MAVYHSQLPSGNLLGALQLWNQFWGPAATERKEDRKIQAEQRKTEEERQKQLMASSKLAQEQSALALRQAQEADKETAAQNKFLNRLPNLTYSDTFDVSGFPLGKPDTNVVQSTTMRPSLGAFDPFREAVINKEFEKAGVEPRNRPKVFGQLYKNVTGKEAPTPGFAVTERSIDEKGNVRVTEQPTAAVTAKALEAQRKQVDDKLALGSKMAGDLEGNQVVQNYRRVMRAYDAMRGHLASGGKDAKGTGPQDIAVIFSFMKLVDPASTVREGEFATAQNAGGPFQHLWGMYNKAKGEGFLTPLVRKQFIDAAGTEVGSYVTSANGLLTDFLGRAAQYGVPANFIRDTAFPGPDGVPQADRPGMSPGNPFMPTNDDERNAALQAAGASGALGLWIRGTGAEGTPIVKFVPVNALRAAPAAAPTLPPVAPPVGPPSVESILREIQQRPPAPAALPFVDELERMLLNLQRPAPPTVPPYIGAGGTP